MIARLLSRFTRPGPVARALDDLDAARDRYLDAYSEVRAAHARRDTRRQGSAHAALRAANARLIRAERAYEEARA